MKTLWMTYNWNINGRFQIYYLANSFRKKSCTEKVIYGWGTASKQRSNLFWKDIQNASIYEKFDANKMVYILQTFNILFWMFFFHSIAEIKSQILKSICSISRLRRILFWKNNEIWTLDLNFKISSCYTLLISYRIFFQCGS